MTDLSPGEQWKQDRRDFGMSEDTISFLANEEREKQMQGGEHPDAIAQHWGDHTPADDAPFQKVIQDNMMKLGPEQLEQVKHDPLAALHAGFGVSSSGMLLKKPTAELAPDATWIDKTMYSIGSIGGSLPAQMTGGFAGAVAGSELGPVGAAAAAGAGGMGFDQALRDVMADYYANKTGPQRSSEELLKMAGAHAIDVAKAMIEGAAGGAVGGKLAPQFGKVGEAVGFGAGAIGAGVVMGDVPQAEDFNGMAMVLLGSAAFHKVAGGKLVPSDAAEKVAEHARNLWATLGIKPGDLLAQAKEDPVIKAELLGSHNADGVPNTPSIAKVAPPAIEPYVKPPTPTVTAKTEEAAQPKQAAVQSFKIEPNVGPSPGNSSVQYQDPKTREIITVKSMDEVPAGALPPGTLPIKEDTHEPMVKGIDGSNTSQRVTLPTIDVTMSPAEQTGNASQIFYQLEHPGQPGRRLGDRPEATSPAGALGPFQIMPDTARGYGFDPAKLQDPGYAEHAFKTIYADLSRRSTKMPDGSEVPWGMQDVAVAYNWGPGHVDKWIHDGRPLSGLPAETQRYVHHLEEITGSRYGVADEVQTRGMNRLGEDGSWQPSVTSAEGANYRPNPNPAEWTHFDTDTKDFNSVQQLPNGDLVPAPELIAGYLQEFGQRAGFKFLTTPPEPESQGQTAAKYSEQREGMRDAQGNIVPKPEGKKWAAVYMPQTPDEIQRKWGNADPYRILWHEVGHALDFHMNGSSGTVTTKGWSTALHQEIIAASKAFVPEQWKSAPDYQMTAPELMANAVAKWMTDPTIRPKMPEFTKKYGDKLLPFVDIANKALPTLVNGKWQAPPEEPTEGAGGSGAGAASGGAGGLVPPGGGAPPGGDDGPGTFGGGKKRVDTDVLHMTPEMALQKMRDIVAPETKHNIIPDWMKPWKWFDAFQASLKPGEALDKLMDIKPGQLGITDMLRMTFGSRGRAAFFYKFGTLDPVSFEPKSDDSFLAGFKAIKEDGGNMSDYWGYRIALRTVELADRGMKSGADLDAARLIYNDHDLRAKYERGNQIIQKAKDASIWYARDSGLLTEEGEEGLLDLNNDHLVLRRVMDPGYNPQVPGRGFLVRNPIKKIKGSDLHIVDPHTAEIDNLSTIIAMADRNRALVNIAAAVEQHNGTAKSFGRQIIPFGKVMGKESLLGEEPPLTGDLLDGQGNKIERPNDKEGTAPFVAYRTFSKKAGPNDFIIFRDGKAEHWRSADDNLSQILRVMHGGKIDPLPEMLTKIASLDRAGVTGSLDFPFRAIFHGQFASAAFAEGGQTVPFHDIMKGFLSPYKLDKAYQNALANGALTSIAERDSHTLAQDGDRIFTDSGTWDHIWNTIKHPIDAMRIAQHKTTAMAQVGFMKRNMEQGTSALKSAMLARKAYLDYGEQFQASWANRWAQMVPFMTTGFKDIAQVTDALKRNPIGTMAKAGMILTAPTLINYAVNYLADQGKQPGSRYSDIPQWERDMFWCIPIGDTFLKMKKPYVGGWLFSTFPEHFLDYLRQGDEVKFHGWATSLIEQTMPSFIPTAITPFTEQWANKNTYTGQNLIPASLEHNSGWLQTKPDTSLLAQNFSVAANKLGIGDPSAIVVDNYMQQLAGPLYMHLLSILEQPFKPPGHPKEMADIPFVGSYFVRNPGASQYMTDFYARYSEIEKAHADLKLMQKENYGDSDINTALSNPLLMNLSHTAKMLQRSNAMIMAVDRSNLDKDAKLQQINRLTAGSISIAKYGMSIMDSIGKQ